MLDNEKKFVYNSKYDEKSRQNQDFLERSELIMLLTIEHAKKVRRKRGELQLGKVQLAKRLKITPPTLAKIEAGNYDAPKRIYESVIEWLLEDY